MAAWTAAAFAFSLVHNLQYNTALSPFTVVAMTAVIVLAARSLWHMPGGRLQAREAVCCLLLGALFGFAQLLSIVVRSDLWNSLKTVSGLVNALVFWLTRTALMAFVSLACFRLFARRSAGALAPERQRRFCRWGILQFTLLLLLLWLPNAILSFPFRHGGGSKFQIWQFMGIDTQARSMSEVIYEGHYITGHHPVLLTVLYGIFFKLGTIFGNINEWGFFLSCLILLLNCVAMAYCLKVISRYVSDRTMLAVLLFLGLNPCFARFAYTTCKDNLYASALLVFSTMILEIVFSGGEALSQKGFRWGFVGISVLVPFLKNQGLIIVLITLALLLIVQRKGRRVVLRGMLASFVLYSVLFCQVLMPALKIAPGGKQEMLSVPFQQTALYVSRCMDELSEEEYEAIDAVLPIEQLSSLFVKFKADPVKFKYKQEATSADLSRYFRAWFQGLLRHPILYVEAFVWLTDGYYALGYDKYYDDLSNNNDLFGISAPQWAKDYIDAQERWLSDLRKAPVLGVLLGVAIYTWITVSTAVYCIFRRKAQWLVILMPALLSIAVCLVGPMNAVLRYALPYAYAVPIYASLLTRREA